MVQLNSSNNFWRNGMLAKYIYVTYTEEQKQQVIRVPNSLAIGWRLEQYMWLLGFQLQDKNQCKSSKFNFIFRRDEQKEIRKKKTVANGAKQKQAIDW